MLSRLAIIALLALVQATPRQTFFTSTVPVEALRGKQAVVETSAGTVVIQLLPEAAPNHVALFMKLAAEGAYSGTVFHRIVRYGVIQGGDPLSRDPAKSAQYGTGGLNQLRFEPNSERHTAGAVSAVLLSGQRDSAGAQFFICATDQPALDGQYTVFGRVIDGLEVVQAISASPADAQGRPSTRLEIRSVTIRDTPPDPFVSATPGEMAQYQAVLETSMGALTLEMLPDKAPETVRSFLRMVQAGVYDGIKVHRVARNFVIQTGALSHRAEPLRLAQQRLVHNLPPEFTNTPNVPGIVSMARGEDPGSGSTSFFICIGECRALDGKYTVFARVSGGMTVLNNMASVQVDGETPRIDVIVRRVRLEPH